MIEAALVQWGGMAGDGFSPVEEGALKRVPQPFRALAYDLIHVPGGVQQPPRELDGQPVIGLRAVDVPGMGPHWCFTVQVCGGTFGRTGLCQLLFVPMGAVRVWQVWQWCVQEIAAEGGQLPWKLAETGLPVDGVPPPPRVPPETVEGLLASLLNDHEVVRVPGAPAQVADVIAAALRVLPDTVAGRWSWSTFLLGPPGSPIVSGVWPDRLRDTVIAERAGQWLATARPAEELDEDLVAALRWLVSQVDDPAAVDRYRRSRSMWELVADIVATELVYLGVEQVAAALDRGDARLLRPENRTSLTGWVRTHAADTITWLCQPAVNAPRELRHKVFLALLDEYTAAPASVALDLPARRASAPEWFDTSVALMLDMFPGHQDKVNVCRSLVAGGTDPARLGPWWEAIGLDRHDPGLGDLFPVNVQDVIQEIKRDGDIGQLGERYLAAAPTVSAALIEFVKAVPPLAPPVAVGWIARLESDLERRSVLRAVLTRHQDASRPFNEMASVWVIEALQFSPDEGVRDIVACLAANAFTGREHPSFEVAEAVQRVSATSAEPANSFGIFLDKVRSDARFSLERMNLANEELAKVAQERRDWRNREEAFRKAEQQLKDQLAAAHEREQAAQAAVRKLKSAAEQKRDKDIAPDRPGQETAPAAEQESSLAPAWHAGQEPDPPEKQGLMSKVRQRFARSKHAKPHRQERIELRKRLMVVMSIVLAFLLVLLSGLYWAISHLVG